MLLCTALALLAAGSARAQRIRLRLDTPGSSADSLSGLEGTTIPGPGEFVIGAGGGVRARPWGDDEASAIDRLISLDLSVLTGIMPSAAMAVNLSYVVLQQGGEDISTYGLGDTALKLHMRILDSSRGGPGLTIVSAIGFPSGSPSDLLGSGLWSYTPGLAADFKILSIQLGANLGVRIYSPGRGEGSSGSDLLWRVGLKVSIVEDLVVPYVYVAGDSGLAGDMGNSALLDIGNRFGLGDGISLDLFGGVGLLTGSNASAWRVGIAFRWQPRIGDLDEDGVSGARDQCPYLPEDLDGFEDDDGCPDPDNDQDGIPDDEDQCPNQAGPTPTGCATATPSETAGS